MRHRALAAAGVIVLIALLIDVLGSALGTSKLVSDLVAIPIAGAAIGLLVAWSMGINLFDRRRPGTAQSLAANPPPGAER